MSSLSSPLRILITLSVTYFTFAILLNSVGTVILQVIQQFDVSKPAASVLEGFKDLPIAIVSFFVASSLPRFGFRRASVIGLLSVAAACIAVPLLPSFWMTKLLFLITGAAFALIKVSVYASVGLITTDKSHHASMLNTIEGVFMLGVLSGYWLFSLFIDPTNQNPAAWMEVYWYLAVICVLNAALWYGTHLDESQADDDSASLGERFVQMLALVKLPMVFVFIISAFLYVLIEQGIGTWLPTFNNEVLKLPVDMSVQATSIFAACLAAGRLSAGALLRNMNWYPLLNGCLLLMAALIVITLPMADDIEISESLSWLNAPIAAYIFPLIGLCMAPIYPAINSVILSTLPKPKHASMTGLIVIFSALGGTTGSLITGFIFEEFDGQTAFYMVLIPIVAIAASLYGLRKLTRNNS